MTATLGGNLATVYFSMLGVIDALRLPRTMQSTYRCFAAYVVLLRLGASPIDLKGLAFKGREYESWYRKVSTVPPPVLNAAN